MSQLAGVRSTPAFMRALAAESQALSGLEPPAGLEQAFARLGLGQNASPQTLVQVTLHGLLTARWACREAYSRETASRCLRLGLPGLDEFFAALLRPDPTAFGTRVQAIVTWLGQLPHEVMFGPEPDGWQALIGLHERFLAQREPLARRQLGVYYTPLPVVAFVVRSLDREARDRLALPQGLADQSTWRDLGLEPPPGGEPGDPALRFLDPAVGSGAFLLGLLAHLHDHLHAEWQRSSLNQSERQHRWDCFATGLLGRVTGLEVMPVPWVLAQLNLALWLRTTGFELGGGRRLDLVLTDALSAAAPAVPATVILGNPPFQGASQLPVGRIRDQLERYKQRVRNDERQIKALSNDYVKFLALAHMTAREAPLALIGYVTPRGFLEGPIFADLRRSWSSDFEAVSVLELQGDGGAGERDEPLFAIRLGLAVSVLARRHGARTFEGVRYGRLTGSRASKGDRLTATSPEALCPALVTPTEPYFRFVPDAEPAEAVWGLGLDLAFGTGDPMRDRNVCWAGGFKTRQDRFTVALKEGVLRDRVAELADPRHSEATLRERYRLCRTAHFDFERAREAARSGALHQALRRVRYRPFDDRWVLWAREVLCEPQSRVSDQLFRPNLCLATSRVVKDAEWRHVTLASGPIEVIALSPTTSTNAYMFPLYRYAGDTPVSNWSPALRRSLEVLYEKAFEPVGWGGEETIGSERLLAYLYGLMHAPGYRAHFASRLRGGFPPLAVPREWELFAAIADLGADLVALHLGDDTLAFASWNRPATGEVPPGMLVSLGGELASRGDRRPAWPTFEGEPGLLERPVYRPQARGGTLELGGGFRLSGVPASAWEYRVGRYPVLAKWLDARRKAQHPLDQADRAALVRMVRALAHSNEVATAIDQAIGAAGGWPEAFAKNAPPAEACGALEGE